MSPDEHEREHEEEADAESEELGRGTGRQGPWTHDEDGPRAAKQEADPSALEVENDPRGGLQSDEYRAADPRDLVEEGGTVMSAPGGAPQEGLSVDERRELGEERRRDIEEDRPSTGRN